MSPYAKPPHSEDNLDTKSLFILICVSIFYLNSKFIPDILCFVFVLVPYMVNNVSVQYNGGFLPEIILLTLCDNIGEPF